MFGRKQPERYVPARVRAYGRARLEIAQRAQTREDWDALWKPPQQYFPFEWGAPWKQCIEYKVDDFAAEVGFFIDVLGLPVNAFNADYAMFTSPGHDFYFAVVPTPEGSRGTPADAFRLQFMVADIFATTQELARRGVHLEHEARPIYEGSQQWVASFCTPHGIALEIWGLVEIVPTEPAPAQPLQAVSALETVEAEPANASLENTELEQVGGAAWDHDASEPAQDEEVETAALRWEVAEEDGDAEVEDDEIEDQYADLSPERFNQSTFTPTPEEPVEYPSPAYHQPVPQPSRGTPPPAKPVVNTFQNGQAMLDHLKQKQSQRQFAAVNQPADRQPASRPAPASSLSFRPAPKTSAEEAEDSIWSQVDQDAEFVEAEDAPAEDEYHYKPIPLKRKP